MFFSADRGKAGTVFTCLRDDSPSESHLNDLIQPNNAFPSSSASQRLQLVRTQGGAVPLHCVSAIAVGAASPALQHASFSGRARNCLSLAWSPPSNTQLVYPTNPALEQVPNERKLDDGFSRRWLDVELSSDAEHHMWLSGFAALMASIGRSPVLPGAALTKALATEAECRKNAMYFAPNFNRRPPAKTSEHAYLSSDGSSFT